MFQSIWAQVGFEEARTRNKYKDKHKNDDDLEDSQDNMELPTKEESDGATLEKILTGLEKKTVGEVKKWRNVMQTQSKATNADPIYLQAFDMLKKEADKREYETKQKT